MDSRFYMRYRKPLTAAPVVFEFDHAKVDWTDVLNTACRRLFPGIEFEPEWKVDQRIGVIKHE